MKQKILGLLVGGLALAGATSPAMAANVTVEVEGLQQTLAPTAVTTPASVNKDGTNSCDGNTAIGALDVAVKGNWSGSFAYGSYSVETLLGESHAFGSGAYWTFYVNGNYANQGACGVHLNDGDRVLFYAGDDPFTDGEAAYAGEPVLLDAPTTAKPGVPFTITAREANTEYDKSFVGTTTLSPSAGATVTGGTATATTGADGTAQVTVGAGPYTLVLKKGNRVPARIVGCATTGSDGLCGTTAGKPSPTQPSPVCTTNGHDGFCGTKDTVAANAAITAISEGKKYAKGKGPRQLAGKVEADASGVKDVLLRLTRNDHGKCSTYDAKTEKLKAMKKCGATHGVWFSAGSDARWSYLLPAKLGRGRYVLDVNVVDKAGNRTQKLARGTSRVVFTVA
jgi:Domain of unknown function (DUF4430)/Bacterial Ig-like domain